MLASRNKLMVFLMMAHNSRNFSYPFPYYGETMSLHFHTVLLLLAAFAEEMIKSLLFDQMPLQILKNTKYYPWLRDCIGAIEKTHIPVVVLVEKALPYRSGRKTSAHKMSWLFVHLTCISLGYCLGWKVLPMTRGYLPRQ